jgi:hypothetical protein
MARRAYPCWPATPNHEKALAARPTYTLLRIANVGEPRAPLQAESSEFSFTTHAQIKFKCVGEQGVFHGWTARPSAVSQFHCAPPPRSPPPTARGDRLRYTVFSKSVRSRFEIAYLLVARGLFVLCSSGPRSKRGASASAKGKRATDSFIGLHWTERNTHANS